MNAGENTEITVGSEGTDIDLPDDNVLVISETRNMVILPYSAEELRNSLHDGREYADVRELIEKKYTIPLSRYKHGCTSRFKEAFALVREREKGTVWEAFGLASAMFFTRLLHPAIIRACKNRDWLDVYLDCLDKNELDEFPFFGIRYELNGPKTKRKLIVE